MDGIKVILADQINLSADRAKILRVSGTQISYQNQTANGSVAGGSILFSNLALPSLANSCISRNMRVSYRVAVSAPAGTLNLYNPNETLVASTTPVVGAGAVAGASWRAKYGLAKAATKDMDRVKKKRLEKV